MHLKSIPNTGLKTWNRKNYEIINTRNNFWKLFLIGLNNNYTISLWTEYLDLRPAFYCIGAPNVGYRGVGAYRKMITREHIYEMRLTKALSLFFTVYQNHMNFIGMRHGAPVNNVWWA